MPEEIDHKDLFSPPGGILIWLIISVEVLTFMMGLFAFSFQRMKNLSLFNSSQEMLNVTLGTVNTIVLLSSGFLMAEAIRTLKAGESKKSRHFLLGTIVLGFVFLVLKGFEFNDKINLGIGLEYNSFFTFYWLLTGFHFLHVVVGLIILLFLAARIRKGHYSMDSCFDVETGGAFWHMCDLIWLLLFPVIYLLH
jgi:nitric oxide reductase NorE protein